MKKNPFKEISTKKEVPPEIKKKVLGELSSIELATDIADLFSLKLASIFETIFSSKKRK